MPNQKEYKPKLSRRDFLKSGLGVLGGAGIALTPLVGRAIESVKAQETEGKDRYFAWDVDSEANQGRTAKNIGAYGLVRCLSDEENASTVLSYLISSFLAGVPNKQADLVDMVSTDDQVVLIIPKEINYDEEKVLNAIALNNPKDLEMARDIMSYAALNGQHYYSEVVLPPLEKEEARIKEEKSTERLASGICWGSIAVAVSILGGAILKAAKGEPKRERVLTKHGEYSIIDPSTGRQVAISDGFHKRVKEVQLMGDQAHMSLSYQEACAVVETDVFSGEIGKFLQEEGERMLDLPKKERGINTTGRNILIHRLKRNNPKGYKMYTGERS